MKRRPLSSRPFWLAALIPLALSLLLDLGCGDKGSPTQPLTPTPTAAPTPASPDALVVSVTLAKLDPPAGVKHAVLATFVVTEAQGRTVRLNAVRAYNYSGTDLAVSGFAPRELAPGQATRFDVTVTSTFDIPCADELYILVNYDNGLKSGGQGGFYNCSTGPWLF